MTIYGERTSGVCNHAVAARPADLIQPNRPKRLRGLNPEQMVRMERESESLQHDLKQVEDTYGQDVMPFVLARGCLAKLVGNAEVSRYLAECHPEILEAFRALVATSSLEPGGGAG